MPPESDSYGTVAGVAAYVGIYTNAGAFSTTTNPTEARVIIWIDQISDMFNIALASAGFQTPITQVDAKAAIAAGVEQIVSDLCHAANAKGRFFSPGFQEKGIGMLSQVWKDVQEWVGTNAIGFINLGVPRVTGTIGSIGSKGYDAAGETVTPIFQRNGFGNTFTDWTGSS